MKPQILELHFLGTPRVLRGGREVKLPRKSVALLAYLAIEGQASREQVASLLWGSFETGNANGNLRRELHRIRETAARDHLETTGGALRLKFYSSDTDDQAAAGDLLSGLQLIDAPEFDTWREGQRVLRHKGRLEVLRLTAQRFENSDLPAAIALYQDITDLEPLSDLNAQNLIRCLVAHGQRDEAERVFGSFSKRLEELGSTPALETAQELVTDGNTPLGNAALLERVGRGKEALEFRLAAADEASERGDTEAALEYLAAALPFQRKASQRAMLHERRFKLLFKLARFDLLEPEVTALELASRGDGRLEGMASIRRAQLQNWQQDARGSLVSARAALENPLLPAPMQGLASYVAGAASLKLGKLLEAEQFIREAIPRFTTEMTYERIQAHHGLAQVMMQRGDDAEARSLNRTAFDLLNDTEERSMRPNVLAYEAVFAMMDERFDRALELLAMARRECEQTGNGALMPMVLINISKAHTEIGNLKESTNALEQALALIHQGENRQLEGTALNNLALNYKQHGQLGIALETGWAAIECARQAGDVRAIAFRLQAHVDLLVLVGDFTSAWRCLSEAQDVVNTSGLVELQPFCQLQKAEIQLAENQPSLALQTLAQLEDHPVQEIRNAALYISARASEMLGQDIPVSTIDALSTLKRWQRYLLPMQLRRTPTPELSAAAHAVLMDAPALQELELRIALELPHRALLERLMNSLETYPELQRSFARRLEQQFQLQT